MMKVDQNCQCCYYYLLLLLRCDYCCYHYYSHYLHWCFAVDFDDGRRCCRRHQCRGHAGRCGSFHFRCYYVVIFVVVHLGFGLLLLLFKEDEADSGCQEWGVSPFLSRARGWRGWFRGGG